MTEQWPYRLSWMIYYAEQNDASLDDGTSLKDLYTKVKDRIPTQKDMEPLLEMDRDESKLVAVLNRKRQMSVRDLKVTT